jgi:Photosystem II protein Y (PsbY)
MKSNIRIFLPLSVERLPNFDFQTFNFWSIISSVFHLHISKGFSVMDTRLVVIAAPLLIAASWALFNIGRLAIQQIQRLGR